MNHSSDKSHAAEDQPTRKTAWWVLLLPPVFVALIAFASPNFRDANQPVRTDPFGSDFLQEWVGGYIVSSDQRANLYDSEHFLAVQHDPQIVGFEWPAGEYYPMIYPPFYYYALSPLAALPYTTATWVWMAILAATISGFFWLMLKYFPINERGQSRLALILAASLFFTPLLSSITLAHKSVILLLIIAASYVLLHKNRPLAAGLVFGLIAFKPHLGLLIGITMLAKRQWRFAAGATLTVCGLVALCFVAGPDLCADYFRQCTGIGDYTSTGGYAMSSAHSLHAVCHLAFDAISPSLAWGVAAGLSVLVVYLLTRILAGRLETDSPTFALQYSAMVIATVLISPHFYTYDLTIMLLPCLVFWAIGSGCWQSDRSRSDLSQPKRWLTGFTLAFVVGAGLFADFAEVTRLQPSLLLLVGLLVVANAIVKPWNVEQLSSTNPVKLSELA